MINTLRHKLLAIFFFFSLLSFSIFLLNLWSTNKKQNTEKLIDEVRNLQMLIMNDSKAVSDYFNYDTKNTEYFKTHKSKYLKEHSILSDSIQCIINEILNHNNAGIFNAHNLIDSLSDIYNKHNDALLKIKDLIQERGFKDDGTEGLMRDYVHKLEEIKGINLSEVLQLRRHEKDYIIRNEEKYIEKLYDRQLRLKKEIKQTDKLSETDRDSALLFLKMYVQQFSKMVQLDQEIGIKNNTALKEKIEIYRSEILFLVENILQNAEIEKNKIFSRINYILSLLSFIIICVSIFFGIYMSKHATIRISKLSDYLTKFVESDFQNRDEIDIKGSNDEIGNLISKFEVLKNEVIKHIDRLESLVEERTYEISEQKNKIELQHEEILTQNFVLQRHKEMIEQHNKNMLDSINYAKKIQMALLPSDSAIKLLFPESFVLYKPKSIVSGDFYWFRNYTTAEGNSLNFVAAADCTGHGVPGAFMSLLGISFLNQILSRSDYRNPAAFLNALREKTIAELHQNSQSSVFDGMDIALCVIDEEKNLLHFAGANRPCYIVRNGNLNIIEGDKMPVGRFIRNYKSFGYKTFKLEYNDSIYIFSDGYADQINGQTGKKILRKGLREYLLENADKPVFVQKNLLNKKVTEWQGDTEQTDDILIVSIKYVKPKENDLIRKEKQKEHNLEVAEV